jgi:hypothetical protein
VCGIPPLPLPRAGRQIVVPIFSQYRKMKEERKEDKKEGRKVERKE